VLTPDKHTHALQFQHIRYIKVTAYYKHVWTTDLPW